MTYRLDVSNMHNGTMTDADKSIWANYCNTFADMGRNKYTMGLKCLHMHNAVDVHNSPYLEFETEADAMAFKLKFGQYYDI